MKLLSAFVFVLSFVVGCAPFGGATWTDGRFTYINVKSASDGAGGPRQDLIVIVDRDGTVTKAITSAGDGTWQTTLSGLAPAVVSAAGHAGGSALVRPARNTTNVQMNVQGTGGSGGEGGNNTVSVSGNNTNTSTGGTAVNPP